MSSAVHSAPEGLCGELMKIIRVRGVTAARRRCQSTEKSAGSSATCTHTPPAKSMAGS